MTNRFKGLDLVDRVPEEIWREVCNIVQEAVTKTIPKKKKYKNTKWLSKEALEIAEKRKKNLKSEKQRKKRKIYPFEEFQRIARRDKKAFLGGNAKKQRKTIEWERLESSSRKLEIPREHFMQRWAQ